MVRRWLRGRRSGQAIVEFALIAPLLLMLVLGIVEFGRAWNVLQVLTDAARAGARTAVIANPTITMDTVANRINEQLLRAGLDTASAVKNVVGFRAGSGTSATVSIAYPYQMRWLTAFIAWTGQQAAFTMNTSVVFRNE